MAREMTMKRAAGVQEHPISSSNIDTLAQKAIERASHINLKSVLRKDSGAAVDDHCFSRTQ